MTTYSKFKPPLLSVIDIIDIIKLSVFEGLNAYVQRKLEVAIAILAPSLSPLEGPLTNFLLFSEPEALAESDLWQAYITEKEFHFLPFLSIQNHS